MMDEVTRKLHAHYEQSFRSHGATPQGVDWGDDAQRVEWRYTKMLAVMPREPQPCPSLLDVGCGYGGLYQYAKDHGIALTYTGLDVVESMVGEARARHGECSFLQGDILDLQDERFDYVVCNGILTQKLDVPGLLMDDFAARVIRQMFALCSIGIAFNVMTTKVNFFSNNLYYRNPAELLAWCMSEISPHVKLDHSYPMFEYTLYVYRQPSAKL
jgi:SAM-dependent methyltransferase